MGKKDNKILLFSISRIFYSSQKLQIKCIKEFLLANKYIYEKQNEIGQLGHLELIKIKMQIMNIYNNIDIQNIKDMYFYISKNTDLFSNFSINVSKNIITIDIKINDIITSIYNNITKSSETTTEISVLFFDKKIINLFNNEIIEFNYLNTCNLFKLEIKRILDLYSDDFERINIRFKYLDKYNRSFLVKDGNCYIKYNNISDLIEFK